MPLFPSGQKALTVPFTPPEGVKTVTIPLGGCGAVEGGEGAVELLWRIPVLLPVSTLRWRLRLRNFECSNNKEVSGVASTMTGCYVGTPKWNAKRWAGAFVSAPKQVLGFTAVGSTSDVFSAWVEGNGVQFTANTPAALSMGFTKPIGKWFFDEFGGPLWSGAGAAGVKAGEAGAPAGLTGPVTWGAFDVRLEYEYLPAGPGLASLVGLVVGDSVASGYALTDGGAYASYETWPTVAGLRLTHPVMCTGPAGASSGSFAVNASFRWTRLNLSTTIPNYAIIALGINDVLKVESLVGYEAAITALAAKIQNEFGIPTLYAATIPPFNLEVAPEKSRVEFNEYLRTLPVGLQGIVELDKQLAMQAKPAEPDPTWGVNSAANPHLNRAAYQRMAGALILP